MSSANDQLVDAVREAGQPGETTPPSELLNCIDGLKNPMLALQDFDQANELFAAFNKDFSFINRARFTKSPIQAADQPRYASLIRWIVRELCHWRREEDTRNIKLVAAFVAAQVCDSGNGFWKLVPDDIGDNIGLTDYLKALVASFAVAFNSAPGARVPIWESEAVEKFKQADAEGDWVAVIDGWQLFQRQPLFTNTLQTQAVRLLYRFSLNRLIEGLVRLRQTPVAMQVAGALTVEQRLRLACASANPHVRLASAYRALTDGQVRPTNLASSEKPLLTELLLNVANDASLWLAWMKAFNAYPVRYPALQIPLGHALAQAPDQAIDAYVKSIYLYMKQPHPDSGRQSVAECLRAFRADASAERRTALWTLAYERWLAWDFNKVDPNQHVMGINWSDLDYALVAFINECMDEAARSNAMESIRAQLLTLEHRWHGSFTDIVSSWNRLLSKFQPYAHASFIANSSEDWLPKERTYMPFEPSANRYLMMMYRVA